MKDYASWVELTKKIGKDFERRAPIQDKEGSFVVENYEQLKANNYFSGTPKFVIFCRGEQN